MKTTLIGLFSPTMNMNGTLCDIQANNDIEHELKSRQFVMQERK